jgi:2-phospho-L-lactate guanylyltransferase
MTTWAIIPVKRLSEAKSSLGEVLGPEQRQRLVLAMLADVMKALHLAPPIAGTIVVSPDEKVLSFARLHGAEGIAEPGLELNEALKLAIHHAISESVDSVLIVPADLPFLKPADIENIVAMASAPRDVVIAPSKAKGTNALFLRPPDIIDLRFGGESFPLHVKEASQAGAKPRIYRSTTTTLDIDKPEDLLKVEMLGLGARTREFLRSFTPKTTPARIEG